MPWDEIEVPKELRQFMLDGAEETILGQKNGAKRQYRYGNLHIREYDDKFLVHTDKVDPREDPLGHLIKDAPEFLVGTICGVATISLAKLLKRSNRTSIISSLIASYAGYAATKRFK